MKCKNRGLTLVEVLVVVTILSVLALSVYTVFKSGIDAWTKSEARLEIYQNGRAVLDQISREIVGAFTTGGPDGAKLVGTKWATPADPDELEFVTDFADSVYKIRYKLVTDSTIAAKKALERGYIDYSVDTGETYASTTYHLVEFVPATIEAAVSNIKFKYLPVMAIPTDMDDWGTNGMDEWPGSELEYSLPEAIKIILTMKDANNKERTLETEVYLPNSQVE